jgi:hypothetical protein
MLLSPKAGISGTISAGARGISGTIVPSDDRSGESVALRIALGSPRL